MRKISRRTLQKAVQLAVSSRSHFAAIYSPGYTRAFHAAPAGGVKDVKPFILADIGEGIREVQIIQWFVQPGARVEEFDKLCEVQSDKASVEITSRFSGIIKKLHYDSDDMATVGKPLVDIDMQGELEPEDRALFDHNDAATCSGQEPHGRTLDKSSKSRSFLSEGEAPSKDAPSNPELERARHHAIATPAVRHLIKELQVEIEDIKGTGKDGRVLKEDVHRHVSNRESSQALHCFQPSPGIASNNATSVALTPIQLAMFKTMTKSLVIPHFLYSDSIDITHLSILRRRLQTHNEESCKSISVFAFVIKAVSQALSQYPILNARLELATDLTKSQLVYRSAHNIGIAVDTPSGLYVPVIRNVQALSIEEIAAKTSVLALRGRQGKFSSSDLDGATFSISNIGSIGGGVVAPIIVEGQMGIVGIGRARTVPSFDKQGNVVSKEEIILSWSADHRLVDGATVARCSGVVKELLEEPTSMLVTLR